MEFSWKQKIEEMQDVAAANRAKHEEARKTYGELHQQFIAEVIRPFLVAMSRAGNPGLIKCLDTRYYLGQLKCNHGFFKSHKPGWTHPDDFRSNFVKIYLDGRFYFAGGEHCDLSDEKFLVYTEGYAERTLDHAQRMLIDILLAYDVPVPE